MIAAKLSFVWVNSHTCYFWFHRKRGINFKNAVFFTFSSQSTHFGHFKLRCAVEPKVNDFIALLLLFSFPRGNKIYVTKSSAASVSSSLKLKKMILWLRKGYLYGSSTLLDADQLLSAPALHPFYFDCYTLLLLPIDNCKTDACLDFLCLFLPILALPLLLSLALSHFCYLMMEIPLLSLLLLLLRNRTMIALL